MSKKYRISAIEEAMNNIDWPLLRKQKQALLRASDDAPLLCGIVHLIDAIQDSVVSDGVESKHKVFGRLK